MSYSINAWRRRLDRGQVDAMDRKNVQDLTKRFGQASVPASYQGVLADDEIAAMLAHELARL